MKTTVIHHSADFDGLFCREIARKFLPDAELIGWDYKDDKIPFPKEGTVYVLDLSPDCFDAGWTDAPDFRERLVWIDHHKSAIEKYPKDLVGYRIDGVAACRLVWQWFTNHAIRPCTCEVPHSDGHYDYCLKMLILTKEEYTKEEYTHRKVLEPLAVRLAGEYDIWDKRDPDAELFQHGLRSQKLTPSDWWILLEQSEPSGLFVQRLLEQGRALQYARTQENGSIIKEIGFDLEWEGLKFLACNAARYNSHLFLEGLLPSHDACFGFKWTGRDWSVSLYHAPGKEHLDLSQIAVKHGGGGHRGACGFRAAKLPFLP